MSALAPPSVIAPARTSAPQGSAGGVDATGFKSLLDTCLDKEAAPAEVEEPEARPADDDADPVATTTGLMSAIPVPMPLSVSTPVAPEAEATAAPTAEAPVEFDPSTLLQGSGEPATAAKPPAGAKAEPALPVAVAPASVKAETPTLDAPEPAATPALATATAEQAAEAAADVASPPQQSSPPPAPPPLRALAERTSRPLETPSDKTADGSASGSADARATAAAAPAAGAQTAADRMAGPSEGAQKPAADLTAADEPVVDAAPAGENAAGSTSSTAQTRETSLSSLSRATIDATAQIAAQILRKLEGRSTRFEMALTPDHLGRVDVKLDINSEGRLAARLAFDNPLAATDLRGRVEDLRRELEDAGFQLADDAFEFTERDSGSSAFDRGQDTRQGQNRAFAAASRLNSEIDVAQPPRWMALSLSPSGVDLKV